MRKKLADSRFQHAPGSQKGATRKNVGNILKKSQNRLLLEGCVLCVRCDQDEICNTPRALSWSNNTKTKRTGFPCVGAWGLCSGGGEIKKGGSCDRRRQSGWLLIQPRSPWKIQKAPRTVRQSRRSGFSVSVPFRQRKQVDIVPLIYHAIVVPNRPRLPPRVPFYRCTSGGGQFQKCPVVQSPVRPLPICQVHL